MGHTDWPRWDAKIKEEAKLRKAARKASQAMFAQQLDEIIEEDAAAAKAAAAAAAVPSEVSAELLALSREGAHEVPEAGVANMNLCVGPSIDEEPAARLICTHYFFVPVVSTSA